MTPPEQIGAVAIGRNEGDRLRRCLLSLKPLEGRTVYVDSGSTDNSREHARALGVDVVKLDLESPFTAARARNAGVAAIARREMPEFIQFIDGDCELQPGWMAAAQRFLRDNPDVAVVCGRRRERFPDATIWNRLIDLEWDTPIGEARACGGDSMMRTMAFQAVGGFDPSLIAGEEPELCARLRKAGWRIWRLGEEMTLHDAAMTRFGQWWRRSARSGHAAAEGAALHGAPPERLGVARMRRALLWGAVMPVGIAVLSLWSPWWLLLLLIYPAQVTRLSRREGLTRAVFLTLGKVPEAQGVLSYALHRLRGQRGGLIEYK